MQNEKEQTQEQQTLELLKELLHWKSAQDIREDINEMFYRYLETEHADSKSDRQTILHCHSYVIEFFTKISKFKEINPYG
jgi:hypothetical protein